MEKGQWALLWDRAKELESQIPSRKRKAYSELCKQFPDQAQRHRNFGALSLAGRRGKLAGDVASAVAESERKINELISEAKKCREESERLLEERRRSDTRKILDATKEPIPPGPFPKLRECKMYSLRHDCNDGETSTSRWNRCEYMKYDNSKSILDPRRWVCTAPE